MKTTFCPLLGLCLALLASPLRAAPAKPAPTHPSAPPLWVTAYYPVWQQTDGPLRPEGIDFTAFSHLIHFSVLPRADGTIDDTPAPPNITITPAQSAAVIGPAHAAGRKVLLCVGGSGSAPVFRPALGDTARPRLVASLVALTVARGYDGLDIDMEPITDADAPQYAAFIRALRAGLDAARPGLLLTAATAWEPSLFASLGGSFDQINIMTYDLSGPWPGFKTWHNSSLYGAAAGQTLAGGVPYPSAERSLQPFMQAGVPRAKLGIGIAFFGDVWSGADGPQQSIEGVTSSSVAYSAIMDQYYQPTRYHWDTQAHAPYLTVASPRAADRKFISFEDERLCAEKVTYARQSGLGGVIIWELGDGYRPNQPAGRRNPLLQAVKDAWRGGAKHPVVPDAPRPLLRHPVKEGGL